MADGGSRVSAGVCELLSCISRYERSLNLVFEGASRPKRPLNCEEPLQPLLALTTAGPRPRSSCADLLATRRLLCLWVAPLAFRHAAGAPCFTDTSLAQQPRHAAQQQPAIWIAVRTPRGPGQARVERHDPQGRQRVGGLDPATVAAHGDAARGRSQDVQGSPPLARSFRLAGRHLAAGGARDEQRQGQLAARLDGPSRLRHSRCGHARLERDALLTVHTGRHAHLTLFEERAQAPRRRGDRPAECTARARLGPVTKPMCARRCTLLSP